MFSVGRIVIETKRKILLSFPPKLKGKTLKNVDLFHKFRSTEGIVLFESEEKPQYCIRNLAKT